MTEVAAKPVEHFGQSLVALIGEGNWEGAREEVGKIAEEISQPVDDEMAKKCAWALEHWIRYEFWSAWGEEIEARVGGMFAEARRKQEPKPEAPPPKSEEQIAAEDIADLKARIAEPKIVYTPGAMRKTPAREYPPAPEPPPGTSELDRLTYPKGLLGHAVQYVEDTSGLPHRWMSLASAVRSLRPLTAPYSAPMATAPSYGFS